MSLSTDYSSPSCFGRSSKSATGNKSTDDEANGAVSAVLKGVSHHYYPSIDSYFDNIQHTQVHFDYVRRLEDDDICVTFLATNAPQASFKLSSNSLNSTADASSWQKRVWHPNFFTLAKFNLVVHILSLRMVVMVYLQSSGRHGS